MEPSHKDAETAAAAADPRAAAASGVVVQVREKRPAARGHPLHALPGGRHLPLPQHLRARAGDVRLGLRRAVRGPHRPPRQARVLRLLAEHRRPHPDPHGHRHGGLDHEHLLGHGHGHPGHFPRLQGAGHPTAAVSPEPRESRGPREGARQHQDLPGCLCCFLV